jgi:hypothetical protein
MGLDQLGINPRRFPEDARRIAKLRPERVIPDAVLDVMERGLPWFEIEFNNEMEKLVRTESVEALLQVINSIGAISSLYPNIIEAVDWHKLLSDINNNLDPNNQILMSADEFKEKLKELEEVQRQAIQLELANQAAQAGKTASETEVNQKETQKVE